MSPDWAGTPDRLVILQYAGDYREAYERLAGGGDENYHAQRYSVDTVAAFTRGRAVSTVCAVTDTVYDEVLENGVRAVGAGLSAPPDSRALVRILERLAPTRLVLRTPIPELLSWAAQRRVPTILTLAESLPPRAAWSKQAALFNDPTVEWVGCYLRHSAAQCAALGVDPRKIVAWRWPATWTPAERPPKQAPSPQAPACLIYVGALRESKGVDDALQAVALLRKRGRDVRLQLVGEGDTRRFERRARRLRITPAVEFAGGVPSSSVLELMRAADIVVVPSRESMPEGLPLVLDHSLCARTPAVASAHPAFQECLEHRRDAMLFAPGDARALADCVAELLDDGALYERISAASYDAWRALQGPIEWGELIEAWLADTPERRAWLSAQALA